MGVVEDGRMLDPVSTESCSKTIEVQFDRGRNRRVVADRHGGIDKRIIQAEWDIPFHMTVDLALAAFLGVVDTLNLARIQSTTEEFNFMHHYSNND